MKITDEKLAALLKDMEMEEPSMSFTRNVMDQIDLEIPPVALSTKVDQRIIIGIASVFILAIMVVFGYALMESTFTYTLPRIDLQIDLNETAKSNILKAFLFVDLVIALLYFDRLLRTKRV
jgi:hypothetical protein